MPAHTRLNLPKLATFLAAPTIVVVIWIVIVVAVERSI